MSGITNLQQLLASMQPLQQPGEYVFCSVANVGDVDTAAIIGLFKEKEGITIILEKNLADSLQLKYNYTAAWITLTVHSSLEAVGLTAAFSAALAAAGISCNVVAAVEHDHVFVAVNDAASAMDVLQHLSANAAAGR